MKTSAVAFDNSMRFDPCVDGLRPMRVLIDARKIGQGGIGVYIDNLVSGLVSNALATGADTRVSVICSSAQAAKHDWPEGVDVIEDRAKLYSFDELFGLPRRIDMRRFDLFHSPHFTLPFALKIPAVVTIHDLIHIYHPERKFYPLIASPLIRSAMSRAARIIAVSESTRADIERFVGPRAKVLSKVRLVPNALDPFFSETEPCANYLQTRFRLSGSYLLAMLSMLKPHKGVADLLEAFASLSSRLQILKEQNPAMARLADVKLVLVGQGAEKLVYHDELLKRAGSMPGVHVLGRVSKQDLLSLYAEALALVVPSTAEGFCLPVLEAKAVGATVVARPVAAVRELLADEDVLAENFSVPALTSAMEKVLMRDALETQNEAGSRMQRALDYRKRYDRQQIAERVLNVYNEVLKQKGAF